MNLIYHKGQNYGDQLNEMIFQHLFPNSIDLNGYKIWGIGSLIGLKPEADNIVIFGSGYDGGMYGKGTEFKNFKVSFVRGPLTKEYFQEHQNIEVQAISDPAILLRDIDLPITDRITSNILFNTSSVFFIFERFARTYSPRYGG